MRKKNGAAPAPAPMPIKAVNERPHAVPSKLDGAQPTDRLRNSSTARRRTVMLVEPVDERAHAVVPQLDHAAVQRGQDPWPLGVEGQALHPVALQQGREEGEG